MLTVSISINGEPIFARTAVNRGVQPSGFTRYEVDDGSSVLHKREDGAVNLAVALLKTINEPGVNQKPDSA